MKWRGVSGCQPAILFELFPMYPRLLASNDLSSRSRSTNWRLLRCDSSVASSLIIKRSSARYVSCSVAPG